jgi:hypothetical protein
MVLSKAMALTVLPSKNDPMKTLMKFSFLRLLLRGATVLILLLSNSFSIPAQILLHADASVVVNRSKANIVLVSPFKGSFYLDDFLLSEVNGSDTLMLVNMPPGYHTAKFLFPGDSVSKAIYLGAYWTLQLSVGSDTMHELEYAFNYNQIRRKVTGKPVLFLDQAYYNVTQATIYLAPLNNWDGPDEVRLFTTIATINGFQVSPGFSAGVGVSFTIRDITIWNYQLQNVLFLPVYLDIRSHFSGKRVAPFISLDAGYNFLLSKKSVTTPDYQVELTDGGLYIAPGFGVRIAVNGWLQIIPSMEYRYESYSYKQNSYYGYLGYHDGMSSFAFCIGIGFQK